MHTLQMVLYRVVPAAEATIKNTITANGPPKLSGRFVTRTNTGPRFASARSFAASDALVDEAGYSPPTPKPVIPRATVSIQNMPSVEGPEAPAERMPPITMSRVVMTIAALRPR